MEFEKLFTYCKSKLGSVETYPFGERPICMKVCNKIFAELYPDAENEKVTLKCDKELAQFYREQYPGVIVRGYHCPPVQQPYKNTVLIHQVSDEFLLDMVDRSYQEVLKGLTKKVRMELFQCITKEELVNRGALYYENIQDAFEQAESQILSGTGEELYQTIKSLRDKNGVDNSYVDFYYGVLKDDERERILESLSDRGRTLLEPYRFLNKLVFMPLRDDLLELSFEMNVKEYLFSTYYFLKSESCVWGNYGKEFPMFFNKKGRIFTAKK